MNATDVLKQQHREVEELFRQIETAEDDEERVALRAELADMLAAHTAIEEELFYPAALDLLGPGARVRESLEEHAMMDFALYRFVNVSVMDETFLAKLATLKDAVMNHLEEEESEMLPQVEGEMDRQRLTQLGERLSARFDERLHEGHAPVLARSLGIVAQPSMPQPQIPATKKAAPARRGAPKRAVAQKRVVAAPVPKRTAAAQKRSASKQAAPQKRTATSTKKAAPARTQAGARGAQPQVPVNPRGKPARGAQKSTAKKQRAAR